MLQVALRGHAAALGERAPATLMVLFARTDGNRFARDDNELGPKLGGVLGERPRETAET
jgi:hypothetical protein